MRQAVPGDAKLLCALGDLTSDVAYYRQAWDQSSHRSSRAQRSLAKHYMGRSEFLQVKLILEIELQKKGGSPAFELCPLECRLQGQSDS